MTNKIPWERAKSAKEVIFNVLKGARPPYKLSDSIADQSKEMEELMIRCWSSDPADRPEFKEIVQVMSRIRKQKGLFDGEDKDKTDSIINVDSHYSGTGGSFSESIETVSDSNYSSLRGINFEKTRSSLSFFEAKAEKSIEKTRSSLSCFDQAEKSIDERETK